MLLSNIKHKHCERSYAAVPVQALYPTIGAFISV